MELDQKEIFKQQLTFWEVQIFISMNRFISISYTLCTVCKAFEYVLTLDKARLSFSTAGLYAKLS